MKTKEEVFAEICKLRACETTNEKGEVVPNYKEMAHLYGTDGVVSSFSPLFMKGFLSALEYAYKEQLNEKELEEHWKSIQAEPKRNELTIGERNGYGFVLDWTMPKPR